VALDCPPDPHQCGTYFCSETFNDFSESKGQKVKLYPRDDPGGEAENQDPVSRGFWKYPIELSGRQRRFPICQPDRADPNKPT